MLFLYGETEESCFSRRMQRRCCAFAQGGRFEGDARLGPATSWYWSEWCLGRSAAGVSDDMWWMLWLLEDRLSDGLR